MAGSDTESYSDRSKTEEERMEKYAESPRLDGESPPHTEEERRFERRTVRKVDVRLLLILGALYSVSLVDRTNLSTARVAGMAKDLKLTVGERYSIVSVVFFVPYIIFEIPSNLVLRKVGARSLICTITGLWGATMIGMGFVKTWEQLAILRTLLGFFESGFFPACVFIIQCWFTRFETQQRMAIFYLVSSIIAGFSGIIGYGLAQMGGYGIAGWRWIFIVEGAITMGLGLVGAFTIQDFPDKNTFLTPEETQLMIDRVNADRGDATPDELTLAKFGTYMADWKMWSMGLCYMATTMPAYAFSYFLPVILQGAGYSEIMSLCLPAPPYIFGAIWSFGMARTSDKYRLRGLFIAINAVMVMIGLIIIGYAKSVGVRYFGSFLVIAAAQSNIPALLTYQANNTVTHSKRGVSSAISIGMGGVGGIFASTIYRQIDYPRYLPGLWATFGCQVLILVLVGVLSLYFRTQNNAANVGRRGAIEGIQGFRYTI